MVSKKAHLTLIDRLPGTRHVKTQRSKRVQVDMYIDYLGSLWCCLVSACEVVS
jgi:hypothetical protein